MSHTLSYLWLCALAVCSSHPSYSGYEKNTDTRCGVSPLNMNSMRINGGKKSSPGAWPWMVALYYRKKIYSNWSWFACGGSLIAESWVLTAAHCNPKRGLDYKLDFVMLGDLDINQTVNDGAEPIKVMIQKVIPHPEFTTKPLRNDIALVELKKPVTFSDYIRPICLHKGKEYATNESIYDKKRPTIAGWGNTTLNERSTTHLLEVSLDIIPLETCKQKFFAKPIQASEVKLDKLVLCCQTPKRDVCQGDSGGPLMFLGRSSVWSQGGIVSYGYEKCGNNMPSVYTKVAAFIDWIEKETKLTF